MIAVTVWLPTRMERLPCDLLVNTPALQIVSWLFASR